MGNARHAAVLTAGLMLMLFGVIASSSDDAFATKIAPLVPRKSVLRELSHTISLLSRLATVYVIADVASTSSLYESLSGWKISISPERLNHTV